MAENLLDKHPGARRYVAHLHAYGATRAQICAKLAEKYAIRAPTPRSMTTWLNGGDPELAKMIAELAAIKADLAPDDPALPELPEPIDRAQSVEDLFGVAVAFPAFGRLLHREWSRQDTEDGDDVQAVLLAGHETAEAFAADCERRLGDYDPHAIAA